MHDDSKPDPSPWQWLQHTYWYVLPENIPALQLNSEQNTLAWIVDQTVWHITEFRNGYFWGSSATAIVQPEKQASQDTSVRPVCFSMLGSITPEGRVYITFIPETPSGSATTGIGRAVMHGGQWSLEMQMATGSRQITAHWAYMTQVKPEDPSWHSLPGVGISVPQMLHGCRSPQLT